MAILKLLCHQKPLQLSVFYLIIFLQRFGQPAQVAQPSTQLSPAERDKVYNCILELSSMKTREHALVELRFVSCVCSQDKDGTVGSSWYSRSLKNYWSSTVKLKFSASSRKSLWIKIFEIAFTCSFMYISPETVSLFIIVDISQFSCNGRHLKVNTFYVSLQDSQLMYCNSSLKIYQTVVVPA